MPKRKRQFEIEIEAKVRVDAFDESSARKKLEKTFAEGRNLGDDVGATGAMWTYAVTEQGADGSVD